MVYPYKVKYNGVYYPAGTDVPVGEPLKAETVTVTETEKPVEPIKVVQEFPYKKTDIMRMSRKDLQALAKKYKLDPEMSGTEIKKQICIKFDL